VALVAGCKQRGFGNYRKISPALICMLMCQSVSSFYLQIRYMYSVCTIYVEDGIILYKIDEGSDKGKLILYLSGSLD
jgi:hypothetical protein